MNRSASNPVVKLLPSLADFAFLMPVAFLFGRMYGAKTLLGDCDTGWHIRTGEWILANRTVPYHDIFSFSMAGRPWYAWEWLSDVVMAALYRQGGLALVVFASVLLIAVTFWMLYRLLCRRAAPLVALLVTMVAADCSSIHWLARPHLFTLFFTVLFLGLLERVAEGRTRILVALPLISLLWTNLHGAFVVGIVLIGVYAANEAIQAVFGPGAEERRQAWRRALQYGASAAGCALVSLVNPYTWRLHEHLFRYLNQSFEGENIIEFLSLNFRHPIAPFFEFLLVAGVGTAIWHARRSDFRPALLVAVWAHGALLAMRHIPLYAIVAAPAIATMLSHFAGRLAELPAAQWVRRTTRTASRLSAGLTEMESIGRWHAISGAGIALVAALLFAPNPPKAFRAEFDPKAYPSAALAAMKFGPEARIFTHDEWGDYLIYRLYPKTKVFLDGRSDFYGPEFEEKYLRIFNVKYDWEPSLRRYGINTILLPTGASLAGALKESSRWRVVYDDGQAVVFQPAADATGAGIQVSAAPCGGTGRDREITKTQARDRTIAVSSGKSKT
jgi:hypothetical protein